MGGFLCVCAKWQTYYVFIPFFLIVIITLKQVSPWQLIHSHAEKSDLDLELISKTNLIKLIYCSLTTGSRKPLEDGCLFSRLLYFRVFYNIFCFCKSSLCCGVPANQMHAPVCEQYGYLDIFFITHTTSIRRLNLTSTHTGNIHYKMYIHNLYLSLLVSQCRYHQLFHSPELLPPISLCARHLSS